MRRVRELSHGRKRSCDGDAHTCRPPAKAKGKPQALKKKAQADKATGGGGGAAAVAAALPREVALAGVLLTAALLVFYACHCIWVSAEMYSAPSIVLQTRAPDGSKRTLDDFREAYAWLRCSPLLLRRFDRLHLSSLLSHCC